MSLYLLGMENVIRIAACVTLVCGLVGCSAPWNFQIENDFNVTSQLMVSGPGKCDGFVELTAGQKFLLYCKYGTMSIKFTDLKGHECMSLPDEIARQTEEVRAYSIFPKHFFKVRLSRLGCH